MRVAFLTPSVGEAFGQEQVLHESVRLLESAFALLSPSVEQILSLDEIVVALIDVQMPCMSGYVL